MDNRGGRGREGAVTAIRRVVLVQPNYRVKADASIWSINPPLQLAYLAGALRDLVDEVIILDANLEGYTSDETARRVLEAKADLVGVSVLTPAHDWAIALGKALREARDEAERAGASSGEMRLLAGGAQASAMPKAFLDGGYDAVAAGEGEEILRELVEGRALGEVAGLSLFDEAGEIRFTGKRAFLDPNDLPLPARDLLLHGGCNRPYFSTGNRRFPWSPILTSRGCPYACSYCNKSSLGHRFRGRSPDSVLAEMEELVETYGIRELNVYDDCFNYDLDRAGEILEAMAERGWDLDLRFSNGLRPDRFDETFARRLVAAGTSYVAFGIESGNQAILDRIPKKATLEQMRESVNLARKAGLEVAGFFMLGLLGDTKETMAETIDFACSLDLDVALFNIATPYPGTVMYETVLREGKLLLGGWSDYHHTSGKASFTMPGMASPAEIEAAYRRASRAFYLRPSYAWRRLRRIRSWEDLALNVRGARRVLFSLFGGKDDSGEEAK